jgi:hypothetical protein
MGYGDIKPVGASAGGPDRYVHHIGLSRKNGTGEEQEKAEKEDRRPHVPPRIIQWFLLLEGMGAKVREDSAPLDPQ